LIRERASAAAADRGRRRRLSGLAVLLAIPAACAASSSSFAEEANLEIAPSYWLSNLSGGGHTGSGARDERFDVSDTFGLDTSQSVPSLDGFIRFGKNRILLGLNHGTYDGSQNLSNDFVFNGTTFNQGGKLRSNLDYDRRRLLYGRPFLDAKVLAAGFLIGLDSYRIDSTERMNGVGSESVQLNSKVPVLGASVVFLPRPSLRLYAEVVAMSLNRGGVDSRIIDGYGEIEYYLIGQGLAISLGYRYADLKGEDKDRARFDLKQKGTFTGLVIRF
jgi:hypothetical protein